MPNTIGNFLIGIGLDTSRVDSGTRSLDGSFRRLRSSAGLAVGAVAAVASGASIGSFVESTLALERFSRTYGVLAQDVRAFGLALRTEGGSVESFQRQIESIENIRSLSPAQLGSFIGASGVIGFDPGELLAASDAVEAYLSIADSLDGLSNERQLNIARHLGLDDASLRFLRLGRSAIEDIVKVQGGLRPVTSNALQVTKDFSDSWLVARNNVGFLSDRINTALLPYLTDALNISNQIFDDSVRDPDSALLGYLSDLTGVFNMLDESAQKVIGGGLLGFLSGLARFIPVVGPLISGVLALSSVGTLASALYDEAQVSQLFSSTSVSNEPIAPALDALSTDSETLPDNTLLTPLLSSNDIRQSNNYVNELFNRSLISSPSVTNTDNVSTDNTSITTSQSVRNNIPPIRVDLTLDGAVLDSKIIDVNESMFEDAMNNLSSSEGG